MDYKIQILNKTRQGLDVFHHYIAFKFSPDKKFKNPLYHDTKASCYIHLSKKTGIYMMKDFGDMEYSGDCFWFVARLLNLDMKNDFVQILRRINDDMGLGVFFDPTQSYNSGQRHGITLSRPVVREQQELSDKQQDVQPQPNITVTYKEFSENELLYWHRYGITQDVLKRFKVRSARFLTGISKEGKEYKISSRVAEPMFVYLFCGLQVITSISTRIPRTDVFLCSK